MRLLADVEDLDRIVAVGIEPADDESSGPTDRLSVPPDGVVAARTEDISVIVTMEGSDDAG